MLPNIYLFDLSLCSISLDLLGISNSTDVLLLLFSVEPAVGDMGSKIRQYHLKKDNIIYTDKKVNAFETH